MSVVTSGSDSVVVGIVHITHHHCTAQHTWSHLTQFAVHSVHIALPLQAEPKSWGPRALPAHYQVLMCTCAEVSPTSAQAIIAVPDLTAGKVPQTILQDD
jgi:hypothetical protein